MRLDDRDLSTAARQRGANLQRDLSQCLALQSRQALYLLCAESLPPI